MRLATIKIGKKGTLPERLIVYGEKGIGKSAFGAECEIFKDGTSGPASPEVVFLPTEDGCSNITGLAQYEVQTTFSGVLDKCNDLLKNEHKYKKVVLDTFDSLYRIASIGITKRDFDGKASKFNSFGNGDKVVAQEMKQLLDVLNLLRTQKKMTIVVLAHAGTVNKRNAEGDDYIKNSGDIGKNTWGLLFGWADRVGYANHEFKVKGGDDSENKKGKVIQRDSERYISFKGNAATEAKTRVGYELKADKMLFKYESYKGAQ